MPKSNGKDAYYFSHDCNARNDNKILAMRSVYGAEGYGLYWMIIEVLRDQPDYSYPMGKYAFKALSQELHCNEELLENFILDCCEEFHDDHSSLLKMDEKRLFSESLNRRMMLANEISSKRSQSANKRWGTRSDANALQMHPKTDQTRPDQNRPEQTRAEENNARTRDTAAAAEMNLDSLFSAYREQTGKKPSDIQESKIREYVDTMSPPVVEMAFDLAIKAGADKWSYTKRILDDWMEAGVRSVVDAQAERSRKFGGGSRPGKYRFASDMSSKETNESMKRDMERMERLLAATHPKDTEGEEES